MKKLNKKAVMAGVAGCMLLGSTMTSYAGTWQQDARGWTYQNDDGSYVTSNWVLHNGSYYYMNSAGIMQTNSWINWNGQWYWLDANGVMVKSCSLNINGKWYRFRGDGSMITGWDKQNNQWYYFDSDGALATGWRQVGGEWYYMGGSDGRMLTGWQEIAGEWYYLYSDGHMATGIQTLDGKQQLFMPDGRWVKDADTNEGQTTTDEVTVNSLFNAAFEDMTWDEIKTLANKYYSNFYPTSNNALAELNKWRATNKVGNLSLSSSLTKSSFALAIANKSHGFYGADNSQTTGVVEYKAAANLFSANLDSLTMSKGATLSEAIQKLYNKEQLEVITNPNYTSCGFGFIQDSKGDFIVIVELN